MSFEFEQQPDRMFRLDASTAEQLLEIAYIRKMRLDADTLLKILVVLRNRMDSLDDESPELGDTEVALRQVYAMYIDMTENAPAEGEALKNVSKSANLIQLRTK